MTEKNITSYQKVDGTGDLTNTEIKNDPNSHRVATFSEVFSNAEPIDYIYMFFGTLGGLITGLSIPAMNVLFGRMLDALNKSPNSFQTNINQICIAFVAVGSINLFSGFFQVSFWSITGERQTQKFREKLVHSILSQEIGWFDTCGASELSTKVAELSGKVQDGMGRKVGDLIQYLSQVIFSLVVGFYLCWQLTVVLIASFPLIALAGTFMINAVSSAQNQSFQQYSAAGGLATESIGAIRTVFSLNAQADIINKYRLYLFKAMRVGIYKGFNVGLGNGLLFFASFLTYGLGFWYGGLLVARDLERNCQNNCLTGGTIISVFFSTLLASMALGMLAPPLTAFTAARTSIASMLDIIERKPLIDGQSDEGHKLDDPKGSILIKNVSFSYPSRPNIKVCNNYNLEISKGETIALVGKSGCGKSTVVNLVLRFYDPNEGTVMLDGVDLKELNIKWLRSKIGFVGQEPVLFSGSIGDNISYGLDMDLDENKSLSDEEKQARVVAAAKQANAHDFIMSFPDGYKTDVGSNGASMSGGQKQRIAIARALIKKPIILLLDEATSALDAHSERIVQKSIDNLQASRSQTTIIIAHRLSTIKNADEICVIDQGNVVEKGTHEELLKLEGTYADLIRLQMNERSEEDAEDDDEEASGLENHENEQSNSGIQSGRHGNLSQGEVDDKLVHEIVKHDAENLIESADNETSNEKVLLKNTSRRFWSMLLKYPVWLFWGLLGAAVFGALFPCWGLLLARSQNMFYLSSHEIRKQSTIYAFFYILLAGVALISATFEYWGLAQVSERVSCIIRSDMFEAIMRRNVAFFDYEENSTGALTTRLSDDSREISKALGESLVKQIQASFTLLVAIALGFSASWRISLVVLASFPLNIIASAIQMQAISGQQYDTDNTSTDDKKKKKKGGNIGSVIGGTHGSLISNAFTQMRTISAFSMQDKISKQYNELTNDISESRANRSIVAGLGFGGSNTSLFLTYALLFWYGSQLIKENKVSFLELMTAILTLMMGALGLGQAMADMGDQKNGVKLASKIFQSIDDSKNSPIDGLSQEGKIPGENLQGDIEFKGVNFTYPTRPDIEVCKDFNLTIKKGQMVAFVGPSGSGKSTLVNLLLRFYDPNSGQIFLDGYDIKELNIKYLRSQIGYVGQEPVLFAENVEKNVMKGRADMVQTQVQSLEDAMAKSIPDSNCVESFVTELSCNGCIRVNPIDSNDYSEVEMGKSSEETDLDVINACKASYAHDFILQFPDGYQTFVGEGSSLMISGGQKQRIAIARALIKNPSILLLDEATSALDANSERIVQESIDKLQEMRLQTTIVIAHRLTTIKNADKICVIEKGEIVEQGTHDELILMKGLYFQLWNKQRGGDMEENK